MKELIEALQIFLKYADETYPTHCEHDILYILVNPVVVSDEDKIKLEELGFIPSTDEIDCFISFKYGSA